MRHQDITRLRLAAGSTLLAGSAAVAAGQPQVNGDAVDKAFEALKTYDWGTDRAALDPIDEAVIASRGDAAARKALETRLLDQLKGGVSRSAQDYVLRTLKTIGTAESVPALSAMLPDEDLSHMARYALERIPAPEAAAAMRDALPKLSGALKAGVIGSLGVRRDAAGVAALAGWLGDTDKAVASAAAHALGTIGNQEAGRALGASIKQAPEALKPAIADACLVCSERLLADGKKAEAILIYQSLNSEDQPKDVRLAATRGLLAAAKKD
jgi:HEAT repeat protein